jgi:hypothetical protein
METPEATPEASAAIPPRQTLAMRMAERSRLRAERAERLARLAPARTEPVPEPERAAGSTAPVAGPPAAAEAGAPAAVPFIGSQRDAAAALEEFLRSLNRGLGGGAPAVTAVAPAGAPAPAPVPGEVLPFQRPVPPEAREAPWTAGGTVSGGSDLERLEGVGPGLVWALRRAGIPDLACVAGLEPEALAARLGPLGRLVPARAWVEAARAAPDLR